MERGREREIERERMRESEIEREMMKRIERKRDQYQRVGIYKKILFTCFFIAV